MLIDSMSEEVIHLKQTVTVSDAGLRKVTLSQAGSLRGAFVQRSVTRKESAGAYIPVTRYTFTTYDDAELVYGDILKRKDGSLQRVMSKKSSPPKTAGSNLRINQYLTEETDYDGREGNI